MSYENETIGVGQARQVTFDDLIERLNNRLSQIQDQIDQGTKISITTSQSLERLGFYHPSPQEGVMNRPGVGNDRNIPSTSMQRFSTAIEGADHLIELLRSQNERNAMLGGHLARQLNEQVKSSAHKFQPMAQFRRKPDTTIIDAEQWWPDAEVKHPGVRQTLSGEAEVLTNSGPVKIQPGVWLFPEPNADPEAKRFYPVTPEVLAQRFEQVS